MVSRATATRYSPSIEALMVEATLDVAAPTGGRRTPRGAPAADPVARVDKVDAAFESMMIANETGLRMMLAQSLQRSLVEEGGNSPSGKIAQIAAYRGCAGFFPQGFQRRGTTSRWTRALAPIIGTEAHDLSSRMCFWCPTPDAHARCAAGLSAR